MFNNIQIVSYDNYSENPEKPDVIRVPIHYARKNKFLERLRRIPDLDKPRPAIVLPVMSFEDTSYSFNAERKVNSRKTIKDIPGKTSIYVSVPYDIGFQLSIYSKYNADAYQIVEKIIPYFRPTRVLKIRHIDKPSIWHKIPVTLTSVSPEMEFEGDFETKGNNIFTLEFELQGDLYGPTKDISKNIIEKTRISVVAHEREEGGYNDELPNSGIVGITLGDSETGEILKQGTTDIENHPILKTSPESPEYNKWIDMEQMFDMLPDYGDDNAIGPVDEDVFIGKEIYDED